MARPASRSFSLRVVLSATTGVSLVPNFGAVSDLFDFIYPNITTIGMADMSDRMRQRLFEQHPDLVGVEVPEFNSKPGAAWLAAAEPWLAEQERRFGKELEVSGERGARSGEPSPPSMSVGGPESSPLPAIRSSLPKEA